MRPWFLLALFIPVETAASGSLVVLGSTVELPEPAVAAPPVERCRERPRLLTPMLVGYAGLQAADAHSTLRALDAGAVEANPTTVAQWAVRSTSRAYGIKAGVTAGTSWAFDRIACSHPRTAFWTITALNTVLALVVLHNYRVGSRMLAAR